MGYKTKRSRVCLKKLGNRILHGDPSKGTTVRMVDPPRGGSQENQPESAGSAGSAAGDYNTNLGPQPAHHGIEAQNALSFTPPPNYEPPQPSQNQRRGTSSANQFFRRIGRGRDQQPTPQPALQSGSQPVSQPDPLPVSATSHQTPPESGPGVPTPSGQGGSSYGQPPATVSGQPSGQPSGHFVPSDTVIQVPSLGPQRSEATVRMSTHGPHIAGTSQAAGQCEAGETATTSSRNGSNEISDIAKGKRLGHGPGTLRGGGSPRDQIELPKEKTTLQTLTIGLADKFKKQALDAKSNGPPPRDSQALREETAGKTSTNKQQRLNGTGNTCGNESTPETSEMTGPESLRRAQHAGVHGNNLGKQAIRHLRNARDANNCDGHVKNSSTGGSSLGQDSVCAEFGSVSSLSTLGGKTVRACNECTSGSASNPPGAPQKDCKATETDAKTGNGSEGHRWPSFQRRAKQSPVTLSNAIKRKVPPCDANKSNGVQPCLAVSSVGEEASSTQKDGFPVSQKMPHSENSHTKDFDGGRDLSSGSTGSSYTSIIEKLLREATPPHINTPRESIGRRMHHSIRKNLQGAVASVNSINWPSVRGRKQKKFARGLIPQFEPQDSAK